MAEEVQKMLSRYFHLFPQLCLDFSFDVLQNDIQGGGEGGSRGGGEEEQRGGAEAEAQEAGEGVLPTYGEVRGYWCCQCQPMESY